MLRVFTRGDDPALEPLVARLSPVMAALVLPDAIQMISAGAFQVLPLCWRAAQQPAEMSALAQADVRGGLGRTCSSQLPQRRMCTASRGSLGAQCGRPASRP